MARSISQQGELSSAESGVRMAVDNLKDDMNTALDTSLNFMCSTESEFDHRIQVVNQQLAELTQAVDIMQSNINSLIAYQQLLVSVREAVTMKREDIFPATKPKTVGVNSDNAFAPPGYVGASAPLVKQAQSVHDAVYSNDPNMAKTNRLLSADEISKIDASHNENSGDANIGPADARPSSKPSY